MNKKSTQNSLVKYLYNECDLFETLEIEYALSQDGNLKESFDQLVQAKESLQSLDVYPSKKTLSAIMEYAKNEMTEHSFQV